MFQAAPRPAGRHAESESGPAVALVPAAAAAGQVSPQAGGGVIGLARRDVITPCAGRQSPGACRSGGRQSPPSRPHSKASRALRAAGSPRCRFGVGLVSVQCRCSVDSPLVFGGAQSGSGGGG